MSPGSPLIGNIPITCLTMMEVIPTSEEVKPWFGQVIFACESLLMPVIVSIVSGHSFGEGGVTEGGTALDVILFLKKGSED